ncbi:transporter substrate-binding domain-containing protein [Hoeflea sp. BAL378]|uniref:transporter substrate-binding domain-containing protein n=1 Tax=Hoeflea sp. BAL378 TaxID=1547437 RepID=UPI000A4A74A2|nr:transporter substrate-binding domain-containing protein [Hoeflea sp. BAL378]
MMKTVLISAALAAGLASGAQAAGPSFVSAGTLTVCTTANFPPLTFKKDPGDALPVGIDIDIANALAGEWNATTAFTTTDFAGLLPTLGSGRCDLIISGIYINEERRQTYDGARYMKSATVLVTKAGNQDISDPQSLSGKTVALESGTYYVEERIDPLNAEFKTAGKPAVTVQDYPTQQAAYQQVLVGRADATLTEEAEGAYRVATTTDQFKIAYTWQSDFTYGIYMRRNGDDLTRVRDTLKKLSQDGFFATLAETYGLDPAVFEVDYDS